MGRRGGRVVGGHRGIVTRARRRRWCSRSSRPWTSSSSPGACCSPPCSSHRFWTVEPSLARKQKRDAFLTNTSLAGAALLLLAAVNQSQDVALGLLAHPKLGRAQGARAARARAPRLGAGPGPAPRGIGETETATGARAPALVRRRRGASTGDIPVKPPGTVTGEHTPDGADVGHDPTDAPSRPAGERAMRHHGGRWHRVGVDDHLGTPTPAADRASPGPPGPPGPPPSSPPDHATTPAPRGAPPRWRARGA